MSASIAARPTTYRGIQMRSRLEATVAAQFDRWRYDWAYEPRAYGSKAGQYLPDFVLFVNGRPASVVEVKGRIAGEAFQILDRMEIVWDSEPDVFLVLIDAAAIRAGEWREVDAPRASFFVRMHGEQANPTTRGVFVLCKCGTVGMRFGPAGELWGRCRGCDGTETPLAYLDPTEYRA